MLKHTRLLLSLCALGFGGLVLAVSLTSVPTAFSATGTNEASKRQLYWDTTVLPDHIAYPVLMAVDRAKLETSSELDQIYLQVEYGNRRIEYTQELLEKDNTPLALSTLTKALKYLNSAGQDTLTLQAPENTTHYVLKTLQYHQDTVESMKRSFPDADRVVLDQLKNDNQIIIGRLQESLTNQASATETQNPTQN